MRTVGLIVLALLVIYTLYACCVAGDDDDVDYVFDEDDLTDGFEYDWGDDDE